jgi:hypothetical protein
MIAAVSQHLEQCHEENCCWVWVLGHGDGHGLDERECSRLPEWSLLSDVWTLCRRIGAQGLWDAKDGQAHYIQKAAGLLDVGQSFDGESPLRATGT